MNETKKNEREKSNVWKKYTKERKVEMMKKENGWKEKNE